MLFIDGFGFFDGRWVSRMALRYVLEEVIGFYICWCPFLSGIVFVSFRDAV